MSGPFISKLPAIEKRKVKRIDDAKVFLQSNGTYTKNREIEARKLISALKNESAAFEKIDEAWIDLIQSLDDPNAIKNEQASYEKYAVDTKDPDKQPYMDAISEINDTLLEVEVEMQMIEDNLKMLNALATGASAPGQVVVVNTPAAEVKKRLFYGNPEFYKGFIDNFMADIGNHASIPDIIKLAKLKERLDGPAFDAISRYTTDAGYPLALDKLKQRFGNKNDAIILLKERMKKPVKDKSDWIAVRKAFDDLDASIDMLAEYGYNVSIYDYAPAIEGILPDEILIQIVNYESTLPAGKILTLDEKRKYIDLLLMGYEKIYGTAFGDNDKRKTYAGMYNTVAVTVTPTKKKPPSDFMKSNNFECGFCQDSHRNVDCPEVSSPEQAKLLASKNHLCFKCFRLSHISRDCNTNLSCYKCDGKHHTLKCKKNDVRKEINFAQPPVLASIIDKEIEKEVLLMTANVKVSHPSNTENEEKVLVLVDPGSEINLIDTNLCKSLNLPMKKETVDCQSTNGQKFEVNGAYNINLQLKNGMKVPITALGTNKIVENIKVPKFEILSKIQQLEPLPIKFGNPRILLSMKEYQKYVMGEKSTNLKNGFKKIDCKLGSIICGEGKIHLTKKKSYEHTVAQVKLDEIKSESDKNALQEELRRERIQRMVRNYEAIMQAENRRRNGRIKANKERLDIKNAEKAAALQIEPAPNLFCSI
uniref:Uncharacterized protein n=1 Tax=Panagrolaimus sp. PS1159 TaxID=55785 RepID=A0AC35GGD8_9BILA